MCGSSGASNSEHLRRSGSQLNSGFRSGVSGGAVALAEEGGDVVRDCLCDVLCPKHDLTRDDFLAAVDRIVAAIESLRPQPLTYKEFQDLIGSLGGYSMAHVGPPPPSTAGEVRVTEIVVGDPFATKTGGRK